MQVVDTLNNLVNKIVNEVIEQFADINLKANDLAVSLIDLTNQDHNYDILSPNANKTQAVKIANFHGEEPIYPASIVKLFYLVAVHRWLEDKKISETDELKRACKDMIVDSSNDATHYVVDVLTNTTAGPELPPQEMAQWIERRNAINRYFAGRGYKNINVNQKTWGDGPYGREQVFVGKERENRNKLTTNATAKLLTEIVTGYCVSKERSKTMLELLARDFTKPSDDPDNQAVGFMGSCLPKTAKLWSKAGWMTTSRHDAAYIELANGVRFILVAFISNHGKDYWILPTIAKKIIQALELHHNVGTSKLH